MNPRDREIARATLAGCAKTEEIHELARAALVAPDLPPYHDDLRAEIDRLERAAAGGAGSAAPVQGSWRMGIREAVSALRPYLSGMQAEIERLRAERPEALSGGDVARWAALADAATPGPWSVCGANGCPRQDIWSKTADVEVAAASGVNECGEGLVVDQQRANAAFIASARTAVPALCAEVARLRAELAPIVNPLKIPCAEPGCYEWSVGVDAAGRDVCREHSVACALCSGDSARETCGAVADLPWPYQCTRVPGHDGKHAACGMDANAHPIVEWS